MKRLSDNPATIRTQIETSKDLIVSFEEDLAHTPLEDTNGQDHLKKVIQEESRTIGRLQRHLDGLDEDFDGMYETANVQVYAPEYEQL